MRATVWILAGWIGCGGDASPVTAASTAQVTVGPRVGSVPPLRPTAVGQSPALQPRLADHPTRWVGQRLPGVSSCPAPAPGFTSVQLLPAGFTPPTLSEYCVYESAVAFQPGPPTTSTLFQSLERDVMALVPMARGWGAFLVDDYADLFLQQAMPVPAATPLPGPVTRLAFVDSTPTRGPGAMPWTVRGRLPHGFTLTNIARALTCDPGGDCLAQISTSLALDLYVNGSGGVVRDPVGGGDFGSMAGLAASVAAEVDAWQRGASVPLILNLSVGWQPEYGGDPSTPSTWPVAVTLVHDVLHDAACRGALIVAAAGNDMGGPTGRAGPIYPGGWEVMRMTAGDCASRVGGTSSAYTSVDNEKLLYAVGAVTEDGYDLYLSRPGSRPPRVAYGSKGTVATGTGYAPLATGTSVAAAIVSSAAAAVWTNVPSLTASQVMARVTLSGSTGEPIDAWFCPGSAGPCGDSRVVDVCGAVKAVCDSGSWLYAGPCVSTPTPVNCVTGPPVTPGLTPAQRAAVLASSPQITPATVGPASIPQCGTATDVFQPLPWVTVAPCPFEQFYSAAVTPYVDPQPTRERCPPCFLQVSTGELYLEWDGGFPAMSSLSLATKDAAGAEAVFNFNVLPVGTSAVYMVSPPLVATAVTATVTGLAGTKTYVTEVDVIP